jgi:hypothetical protein
MILVCALSAGPAFGQFATTTTTPNVPLNTDQFDYDYVAPKNPAHMPLYTMLREARLLEKVKEFLSPIRLPERITLRLVGCDGVFNAYFFKDEVKICYEYFEYIQKYTAKAERFGLTPKGRDGWTGGRGISARGRPRCRPNNGHSIFWPPGRRR